MTARLAQRSARLILVLALAAPVVAVSATAASTAASAATPGVFVVNSTGDLPDSVINGVCSTAAKTCSFRAALAEANAFAGPATIDFALPGTGPFSIFLTSRLPNVTNPNGITIDGYSQPGSVPNTAQFGSNAVLQVNLVGQGDAAFEGLVFTTSNNTVRGLAVYNFRHSLWLEGTNADHNTIVGDFICTDSSGTARAPAVDGGAGGILIQDGASYNVIGSPNLADRNIISGCAHRGVIISYVGTSFNKVQDNVVGLNPSGTAALPNFSHGIDVNYDATDNLVGGLGPNEGNVSSGNVQEGIEVSHGTGNRRNNILGNCVGTDITCTQLLPYTGNGMMGIRLEGAKECDPCDPNAGFIEVAGNVVVGNQGGLLADKGQQHNSIHDNLIGVLPDGTPAGNALYGVRIEHGAIFNQVGPNNQIAFNPVGIEIDATESQPPSSYVLMTHDNTITRNSIHDNTALGIDLAPYNQVNQNGIADPNVADGIQTPSIAKVLGSTISGTACAGCSVEVYLADATTVTGSYTLRNFGEGQTYEGTATADPTTGAFTLTLASPVTAGQVYTADAIDANGNTSEFCHDVVAGGPTVPVGVTAPDTISLTNSTTVTVSGSSPSAAVSATITLTDQASTTVTTTVPLDSSGDFSSTMDASGLADGPISVSVYLTDAASQTSPTVTVTSTKDTVSPALLSTSPSAGATVASPATVTFTYSEPLGSSASVSVQLDGSPLSGTSAVLADPTTVVFTPTAPIGTGALSATATVTDLAGNPTASTLSATVDATPPGVPTLVVPATVNGVGQVAVPVSGSAEALATVDLSATDGTHTATATTGADGSGAYATTMDLSTLVDGTITVSAVAVDGVGNSSDPATTTLVKNSAGPKLVSSTPALGSTVASPGTVTLTFDRTLASGSSVSLNNGVSNVFGQVAVSGQSVTFTPLSALPTGTYTAAATAVDGFANATAVQVTFTVDATPPAAPTVTPPAPIDYTTAPAAPFGGTAEPGSTVTVSVSDGGSPVQGSTTADPSGNWSLGLDVRPLADGTLSVSATATDAVGNVSSPTTLTVTKQTLPGAPSISGVVALATQLTVNLVAPAKTGGLPVTGYQVTLVSGATTLTFTSTTPTVVATGLPQGTAYNVTAQAQTAAGYGPSSAMTPATTKYVTKVTISAVPLTVPHGGTLSFSGLVTRTLTGAPVKGAKVIVWQVNSLNQKAQIGRSAATGTSGQWALTITPATGSWRYYATWNGDALDVFCQSPMTPVVTVS
jgi:hypothetical protein